MSRPISLFSGYLQRENRTTNYCLLILKMLYEENPKFLAEVLSTLVGEELGERIGVKFRQQEMRQASIPDGLILQAAVTVYIETKEFDWFYDEQLVKQLAALDSETPGFKVLIALGRFDDMGTDRFETIRELCDSQYKSSIAFAQVTFEELAEALRLEHLPKNLADAVADFAAYLDEQDLLPSWKSWLDVVNCAGVPDDVLNGRAYMCPATGGAYNHRRCKYFGMYRLKRVEKIAMIDAVVDLEDEERATVKWQNVPAEDSDFIARARAVHQQRRPGHFPTRVFLLGELFETNFQKGTPGGMLTSKQYFDISGVPSNDDAQSLATSLVGRTWSDLRSLNAV